MLDEAKALVTAVLMGGYGMFRGEKLANLFRAPKSEIIDHSESLYSKNVDAKFSMSMLQAVVKT